MNDDDDDSSSTINRLPLSVAYGLVDGFNTSSSTLRLLFDISYNNTRLSIQALHEWMLTQTGIVVTILETLLITGLSLFSNIVPKSKDTSAFSHVLIDSWKHVRDTYKAFKNAYKGIRSLLQTVNLNSFKIIFPAWIVMGFLSALNRIGYRQIVAERQYLIQENKNLQSQVNTNDYDLEQLTACYDNITSQTSQAKILGFLLKAYGGLIDGLYLYMGIAVVLTLTPEIFTMVVWFSTVFVLTCIATRLYEEHTEQRKVTLSQDRVNLAIRRQELNKLLNALQINDSTQEEKSVSVIVLPDESEPRALASGFPLPDGHGSVGTGEMMTEAEKSLLEMKMRAYLSCKHTVHWGLNRSSNEAILDGLKNGLAIYGVISALLFSAYTVTLILSCSFPEILIPISAALGVMCLIGCSIYSYWEHSFEIDQPTIDDKLLVDVINEITNKIDVKSSAPSIIPKHSEVLRSGSSGIGKAPKAIEFALGGLQDQDGNGHYHDSPFMFFMMIPCTLFYVFTLGFSSYRDEFPEEEKDNSNTDDDNYPSISASSDMLFRFFTPSSLHIEQNACIDVSRKLQIISCLSGCGTIQPPTSRGLSAGSKDLAL